MDSENKLKVKDIDEDPGGTWKCICCNLEEHYDYKGNKPPFVKNISFLEECYIMKDPFSSDKGEILLLGADCSVCQKSVCMECSFYYIKRFCKFCAMKKIEYFPSNFSNKILNLNKHNDEQIC